MIARFDRGDSQLRENPGFLLHCNNPGPEMSEISKGSTRKQQKFGHFFAISG